MEVIEAIRSRKSIRGYKPDPVPRQVLRDILETATRSPSAINTQPWEAAVVTGEVFKKIKSEVMRMYATGVEPHPDMPRLDVEGIYQQRRINVAIQLWGLMGITREDKKKRAEWEQRGRRYFDAPAAIILYMDRALKSGLSIFDVGSFAHAICLAAWNYGLGTCIMNQGVFYPEIIRKCTHIPESKQLIICIIIGYPDWDFPANRIVTPRESVDNVVSWHGFD